MATYKLIKKYPGLPSNWEIGIEITENMKYGYFSAVDSKYSKYFIANNNDMENTPEFWQKVEELEYEILSIKSKSDGVLFKVNNWGKDGTYLEEINPVKNSLEYISKLFDIYSVKRIRDNVVFTIGDLCNPIGEYSNNKDNINRIWFCDPGYLRISSDNYCLDINDIEHSKKVLFVTEDGVEIFKGDNYTVMFYDWILLEQEAIKNFTLDNATLRFSTKENAQEYVLYNKPMFSLQEIGDIHKLFMNQKLTLENLFINKTKEKQNGNT